MDMEGGFPYGDIIVIGAIAAFILLRYRSMLGEDRGRDPRDPGASAQPTEMPRVIQLPASRLAAATEKKEDFSAYGDSLARSLSGMREMDPAFSPEEFLHGARIAYEMVITAFSKRDHETLRMLLSKDMYNSFKLSLEDSEKEKRFNDTTLLALTKANIKAAKLAGNQATLTVDFVSEQIHLIRDETGKVIEGDASHQHSVEDEWVFTRNLTSSSPNWTIVET
jgi:predicted lipid-binding transport protein (Tim44 family)